MCFQASRAQAAKWLSHQAVDPNDPRNAALIELLRAQEAAAGASGEVRFGEHVGRY